MTTMHIVHNDLPQGFVDWLHGRNTTECLIASFSVFQSKRILLVAHIILSSPNFAFLWMSAWSFPLFTGKVSVCKRRKTATGFTFICPCIANMLAEYNQQDATFHNLFISVGWSTFFRRFSRPSSGVQKCKYSVRYLSDRSCHLLLAWPG